MPTHITRILLANDDTDDCLLFKEALDELNLNTALAVVQDGEQLIKHLETESTNLPDVLFLDLNMPRKNGYTALQEIKSNKNLQSLPVVIFSTSYDKTIANQLFEIGAQYFICIPDNFSELKKVIQLALSMVSANKIPPQKEHYLLTPVKEPVY